MHKQTRQFAVVTENKVVKKVGRSTITQPKINFNGKGINWYDDTKLLKKPETGK